MRSTRDLELATKLAAEWLDRFPEMSTEPETEMMDRLIRSRRTEDLGRIGLKRGQSSQTDDDRRRNWDAVELFVDFESARSRLERAGPIEREMLWHLRARLDDRDQQQTSVPLSADQLAWIIRVFRPLWPARGRPGGGTWGNTNDWDASEYVFGFISRLGNDASRFILTARHQSFVQTLAHDLTGIVKTVELNPIQPYEGFARRPTCRG
jgi:hypothetical protein